MRSNRVRSGRSLSSISNSAGQGEIRPSPGRSGGQPTEPAITFSSRRGKWTRGDRRRIGNCGDRRHGRCTCTSCDRERIPCWRGGAPVGGQRLLADPFGSSPARRGARRPVRETTDLHDRRGLVRSMSLLCGVYRTSVCSSRRGFFKRIGGARAPTPGAFRFCRRPRSPTTELGRSVHGRVSVASRVRPVPSSGATSSPLSHGA